VRRTASTSPQPDSLSAGDFMVANFTGIKWPPARLRSLRCPQCAPGSGLRSAPLGFLISLLSYCCCVLPDGTQGPWEDRSRNILPGKPLLLLRELLSARIPLHSKTIKGAPKKLFRRDRLPCFEAAHPNTPDFPSSPI